MEIMQTLSTFAPSSRYPDPKVSLLMDIGRQAIVPGNTETFSLHSLGGYRFCQQRNERSPSPYGRLSVSRSGPGPSSVCEAKIDPLGGFPLPRQQSVPTCWGSDQHSLCLCEGFEHVRAPANSTIHQQRNVSSRGVVIQKRISAVAGTGLRLRPPVIRNSEERPGTSIGKQLSCDSLATPS
jgi:hypothetical protein